MPDPILVQVRAAIADQLDTALTPHITDLQVAPSFLATPQTPTLHIRPDGEPFGEASTFGVTGGAAFTFVVIAVVSTADSEGAQDLLLSMMDPYADTSVRQAINNDPTLGGLVDDCHCDHPSDFAVDHQASGRGALLGCSWAVRVEL